MPAITKRRPCKDGHVAECSDSGRRSSTCRKAARSQSCRTSSSSALRTAIQEETSSGYLSCTSTPFSSAPSSPSSQSSAAGAAPGSRRKRATVRERTRMHKLNDAYDDLRTKVPTYPCSEKPSKIQTLRLAMEYIADLSELLEDTHDQECLVGEDVSLDVSRSPRGSTAAPHSTDSDSVFLAHSPVPQQQGGFQSLECSSSALSSSSCSSSDTWQYQPKHGSVITHFIAQTTGCTAPPGASTSSHSDLEPEPIMPLVAGNLSPSAPRSQPSEFASYSVNVTPSFYAAPQQAAAASSNLYNNPGFILRTTSFGDLQRETNTWTSALSESGLGLATEGLLDHPMMDLYSELSSSGAGAASANAHMTDRSERSVLESFLFQTPTVSMPTMPTVPSSAAASMSFAASYA